MDEAGGRRGPPRRLPARSGADDGRLARRPFLPGSRGEAAMLAGGRFNFREPETIRAIRGFSEIPPDPRRGSRGAGKPRRGLHIRARSGTNLPVRLPYGRIRRRTERQARRALASRALSRRHHRGPEAFRDRAAALRVFRTQGRAAGPHHSPDDRRSRSRHGNRGLPDRSRAGRPGAFFAQCLPFRRRSPRGHGAVSLA